MTKYLTPKISLDKPEPNQEKGDAVDRYEKVGQDVQWEKGIPEFVWLLVTHRGCASHFLINTALLFLGAQPT